MTVKDRDRLLSGRQREILNLLSQGHKGPSIASELGISVCTVRIHIRNAMQKLEATNITHAVTRAFLSGLLN